MIIFPPPEDVRQVSRLRSKYLNSHSPNRPKADPHTGLFNTFPHGIMEGGSVDPVLSLGVSFCFADRPPPHPCPQKTGYRTSSHDLIVSNGGVERSWQ